MTTTAPSTTASTAELERFRTLIEDHLGLRFDPDATSQPLARVLALRLAAHGQDCESYLRLLQDGPRAELRALGSELTVGETYFLRHLEQFQALTQKVVPERLRVPGRSGPLQILSAGCSSGEETYSLAIALHEYGISDATSILGIDVNPAAVAKARQGQYTPWSLRSVPNLVRQRWFSIQGNDVQLDQTIRDRVRFQQANLVDDDPVLWRPNAFDVVFCRNVLMYFAPEMMAQVVRRIAVSLAPGGYLFLGSAETLRGVDCDLRLRESHGTFYYQREPSSASVIRRPPQDPLIPAQRPLNLELAMTLLRQERFAEALAAIDEIPHDTDVPEFLLLRAALLTHSGSYPAAVAASHRLLEIDQFSAGAHALLATCRESEGDLLGAIAHCRTAISRDPGFAMAHVQLARLTQQTGDRALAGAEYATSARLLPAETDQRILLFGGGFDREALISLCRTQVAGVAGRS